MLSRVCGRLLLNGRKHKPAVADCQCVLDSICRIDYVYNRANICRT